MATVIDSIPVNGLRKAHLRQLSSYIHDRDREGWYYGPKEHFERRHIDLLKLADYLDSVADDPDAVLPRVKRKEQQT